MRLFNGFAPEEDKLAQYAGVYVLKWRQEFGEPEMLFCEADEADELLYRAAPGLLAACEEAAEALNNLIGFAQQEGCSGSYDEEVLEMVEAAVRKAKGEVEVEE